VREQDDGALGGEGLGDRAPDAAARAGDDRAQTVQPAPFRRRIRRRRLRVRVADAARYPSTPAANGWRAVAPASITALTLGSWRSARAIDSLVAW
jgi:hypothetical protein